MSKFLDSNGTEHEAEISDKPREIGASPYDCIICGEPAMSPAYKRYCWECYYKKTDGKVFD